MSSFAIRIIAIPVLALAVAIAAVFYFRPPQTRPAVAIAPPSAAPDAQLASPASPGEQPPRPRESPAAPQSTAALPAPPSAGPSAAPTAPRPPEFDIVRVAPGGETVVAGRAPGAARVELLDQGKVIAGEKVDRNGEFVILPPALGNGDHLLALRVTPEGQAAVASNQSVAVVVRPGTSPIVTLAELGKPSVVLAAPVPAPAAPEAADTPASAATSTAQVTIQTAEVEAGGRFFATGTARPGSTVRLYLNGSHVADAAAASDGKWSLTINKGVSGGKYALRADAMGEQGKVVSRAEVPFEAPAALAAAPTAPVRTAAPPTPGTAEPVQRAGTSPPPETSPPPSGQTAALSPPSASPAMRADQARPAPPNAPADRPPAGTGSSAVPNNPASNAVVPEIASVTVARGDSLWRISRQRLGHGMRYTVIYEANASQIRNPNLIYSGQVFVLPGK